VPSTTLKSHRPRTVATVARVAALPLAIAVMAATVALQPSDDAPSGGSEQAMTAQAVLASAAFTLSDSSGSSDLRHSLTEQGDGSYDLSLWRDAGAGAGASDEVPPVVVTFNEPIKQVQLVDPGTGSQQQTTWTAPRTVTVPVTNALVLLKVVPGVTAAATVAPKVVQAANVPLTPTKAAAVKPASTLRPLQKTVATGAVRIDSGGQGDVLRSADTGTSPSAYLVRSTGSEIFYSPNAVDTSDPSVPTDTPSSIFQSERWSTGSVLGYDVPVPNGRFLVRLYTAETDAPAQKIGGRLMDVGIEGAVLQHDLDTFARVGANKGYVTNYVTTVTDGVLNLRLTNPRGTISPRLDAFDVIPLDTSLSHPAAPAAGGTDPATGAEPDDPITSGTRDAWLRPFTSHSIWNMPIGSGAQYVPADIPAAGNGVNFDQVFVIKTSAADPLRAWLQPGSWTNRCSGSVTTGVGIRIPDNFLVADAHARADGGWDTPNYAGIFLRPDGQYADNTSAVARCVAGGPIYGYKSGNAAKDVTDLYGDGTLGSHGASGLSSLGGLIRPGELSDAEPIRHALDLVLWAKYLNYGSSKGYRWPAVSADAYASTSTYAGSNTAAKMGSLLALPPGVTPESAGITSPVALKIFRALQDYGGYITDDAAWDSNYLSIDKAALGTFTWGAAEKAQVNKLISLLSVVNNNSASSIGGGGTPRQPLLPELTRP
jgi:hypothetical protein